MSVPLLPLNKKPLNQEALKFLKKAQAEYLDNLNYLLQLILWGLENGVSPEQNHVNPLAPQELETKVASWLELNDQEKYQKALLGVLPGQGNEGLDQEEAEDNLLGNLQKAKDPLEASGVLTMELIDNLT